MQIPPRVNWLEVVGLLHFVEKFWKLFSNLCWKRGGYSFKTSAATIENDSTAKCSTTLRITSSTPNSSATNSSNSSVLLTNGSTQKEAGMRSRSRFVIYLCLFIFPCPDHGLVFIYYASPDLEMIIAAEKRQKLRKLSTVHFFSREKTKEFFFL